jgi:glyoxylase-like metal-dependent hydrolase (beta-lactamase superfamily II)
MTTAPEIVTIPNGQFFENCLLVADPNAKLAAMVDPGEEADRFLAELERRDWTLEAIWLTHAHIDHVLGVHAVKLATGVPIHLHPLDRPLYDGLAEQARWFGLEAAPAPPPDVELADCDTLTIGEASFQVRHTPGHSPGSVSLVGHGVIIGGDVLFQGSIGRTDLPGGSFDTLMESIQREFLSLPDETIVYTGHGPHTTVGAERRTNPFVTGAIRLA